MKTQPISDTGMVLPGAPKDRAKSILSDFDIDTLNTNLADTLGVEVSDLAGMEYDDGDDVNHLTLEEWQSNLTKAKVWPSPDYADMVEAGIPYPAVRALKNLYDVMPAKVALPTPGKIAELAAIFAEGQQMENDFREIWAPMLERDANDPPSFLRIAQRWVASAKALGVESLYRGDFLNKVSLPGQDDDKTNAMLSEGIQQSDTLFAGFKSTAKRLQDHYKSYMGFSMPKPIFNACRKLRTSSHKLNILTSTAQGDSLVKDMLRSKIYDLERLTDLPDDLFDTPATADERLGSYLSVFYDLKKKPRRLPEEPRRFPPDPSAEPDPEQEAVESTESSPPELPKKPRRPIRLSEEETKALLNEVDTDELKESPEYQSFSPLVEAGIVRGAQIGNWVTQKERPALVKKNYDAITSLTDTLHITPSLFGLGSPLKPENASDNDDTSAMVEDAYNGKQALGVAFGARGRSSASAHFEPSLFIINLTRKKGAGSLAHEWMHALDFRLGTLLDRSHINNKYHPQDIKRITVSPRLEYFSEYMAMFWQLETVKARHGSLRSERELADAVDAHIVNGVRSNLPEDTFDAVLPLMHGISNMMRDIYHVRPTPEDRLEKIVECLGFNVFSESKEIIGDKRRHQHEDLLRNALGDDNNDFLAWQHHFDVLTDTEFGDPSNHWSSFVWGVGSAFLGEDFGKNKATQLERELNRDIPAAAKETIQDAFEAGQHLQNFIHVIDASARYRLESQAHPPRQGYGNGQPQEEMYDSSTWRHALMDTFRDLPDDFLNCFIGAAERFNSRYFELDSVLDNLPPTEMGKNAGLQPLKVSFKNAGDWFKGAKQFLDTLGRVPADRWDLYRDLRAYCRDLSPTSERQAKRLHPLLGKDLANLHTAMTSDLAKHLDADAFSLNHKQIAKAYQACSNADPLSTKEDELPPDQWWDKLLNEEHPEVFQRLAASISSHAETSLLLLAQAHLRSEFNDGSVASLVKTFSDPARLEPFPVGITTFSRDFVERRDNRPPAERPDVNDPTAMANHLRNGVFASMKSIFPISMHSSVDRLRTNLAKKIPDRALWEYASYAIFKAMQDGDTSGLSAFDNAIRDGDFLSLRYRSSDETRQLFSEILPASRQEEAFNGLSPEALLAQTKISGYRPASGNFDHLKPLTDPKYDNYAFNRALSFLRENSLETATSNARGLATREEMRIRQRSRSAAHRQDSHVMPAAVISDFLQDSVFFEGGSINPHGQTSVGSRKYWSQTCELFARMMEKVVHEVQNREARPNAFLVTVPSNESQKAALKRAQPAFEKRTYGQHYALAYPASKELDRLVERFEKEVVPNMQLALSTLYPDSVPHYEAYLEARDNQQAKRLDIDDHDRLTSHPVVAEETALGAAEYTASMADVGADLATADSETMSEHQESQSPTQDGLGF
jgi:hypothetical protein